EGGQGPEVGHAERALGRERRRQDLPPDRADADGGQGPAVVLDEPIDDLRFPLRNEVREVLPSFEVSDSEGGLGALVEEVEELVVEVVDPGTPIVQVHRHPWSRSVCCAAIIGPGSTVKQAGVLVPYMG